jgi:hypothetical protein
MDREVVLVGFGYEGFLNAYLTVWDEKEINVKIRELNVEAFSQALRQMLAVTDGLTLLKPMRVRT